MSAQRDALSRAFMHALAHLDALDVSPVASRASYDDLRKAFGRALPERGLPAAQVVDELAADAGKGLLGSQSGRFFAWVIGGGLPAAMAADWLTTAWDQNAGIYACSPAAMAAEEAAGEWLKELFGLPDVCSFAFVTGAQMAHVTCLAAARHAVLEARGWDVERRGLAGAPRVRVLASVDRHGSLDRAVRLLGMGLDAIEPLDVDAAGCVTVPSLSRALAASGDPTILALQAGELNAGSFDPFERLVPVAHASGAWVHVDGAFGLWARVSPQHRELARGIELCDSWTTDGHKYLNVPYDSGFAFVRNVKAHRAAMTLSASYLPAGEGGRNAIDWNPEFSRRARAFPVYAAIRELGKEGLAELVARTCRHAASLAEGIGKLEGAELVAAPVFNQGLVRFLSPRPGASVIDHDRRTENVIAAVNGSGEAMFGGVDWRGQRVMRISVCNWRTDEEDVERTVAAVARALAETA